MSDTDEKILDAVSALAKKIEHLEAEGNKRFDRLDDQVSHINTALKVLPTKGDMEVTVEAAKSELKADLIRKIQRHERRITNLEEEAGIDNPEKN